MNEQRRTTTVVSFGAVKEKTYSLIEQGEYVLTLSELEESEGQWGDRMVWKFLVAPKEDFAAYFCRDDGNEHLLWAFTDRDVILGSLAHEFVEKLSGRKFGQDAEPPSEDELLGKRCFAYVTHETPTRGKNAGKKREAIVPGSIKPWRGPAKTVATVQAPATPTGEESERAELVAKVEKLTGKAVRLGTPSHTDYVALNLGTASIDDLQLVAVAIQDEIEKALDD